MMNTFDEYLLDRYVFALSIEAAHSEEGKQGQKEYVEHRTIPGHEEGRIELELGGYVELLRRFWILDSLRRLIVSILELSFQTTRFGGGSGCRKRGLNTVQCDHSIE